MRFSTSRPPFSSRDGRFHYTGVRLIPPALHGATTRSRVGPPAYACRISREGPAKRLTEARIAVRTARLCSRRFVVSTSCDSVNGGVRTRRDLRKARSIARRGPGSCALHRETPDSATRLLSTQEDL